MLTDSVDLKFDISYYNHIQPDFLWNDSSLWCIIESNLNFEKINRTPVSGCLHVVFNFDSCGKILISNIVNGIPKGQVSEMDLNLIINEIKRVLNIISDSSRKKPNSNYWQDLPCLLTFSFPYYSYKCDNIHNATKVYVNVDRVASFISNGSNNTELSVTAYLRQNYSVPTGSDLIGTYFFRFEINENGKVREVVGLKTYTEIDKCLHSLVETIKLMPNWEPAEIDGRKVKSYYFMPIRFYYE